MTLPFIRLFRRTDDGEPELTLARGMEDLRLKSQVNVEMWGMDKAEWATDLDTGEIVFTNRERKLRVVAPVQVIGTFNTEKRSWLWGWDHPSVRSGLDRDARLARDFGEKYGLDRFTTRLIDSSEDEAWQFTGVACYLAKAQGAYRGPFGATMVFMTFGEVTISKL